MAEKPQSALAQYKARRGAVDAELPETTASSRWRYVRLVTLMLVLAGVYWQTRPTTSQPVRLAYEIDLSRARQGSLYITIVAEGRLPDQVEMAFPPGVFGDNANGVTLGEPTAHELDTSGASLQGLRLTRTENGWMLDTRNVTRAGLIYRVDLDRIGGGEEDIRQHISTPVSGGVRAAGFEIFLEPLGLPVEGITVMMHNPDELAILVPWPALISNDGPGARRLADASLGYGQGFRPLPDAPKPETGDRDRARTTPVPANLLYHPRNLADLNNALLVCGNIRTLASQADDCVIQLATDRHWLFADEAALDLVRRVARTQIGFFGSAPTDQITVLLSANDVTAQDRFDVYGVHTGSSVLVMMDENTTWGEVEDQAASVISHEMFHGWLGEAIPQSDPQMLWFTEGATTWYAARMLTAAGVWSPSHARGVIGARLERDYGTSDLLGRISVAAAAAEVMATADQVRFAYAGGASACMALDEMLTRLSGGQRPLDLVLRRLYDRRDGSPLTRDVLVEAVREVTGVDCGTWLDAYVYGKTTLPPVKRMI